MDELQLEAALLNGVHWHRPGPAPCAHDQAVRADAALQALFVRTLAETLARARMPQPQDPSPRPPHRLPRPWRLPLSAREAEVMEHVAAGGSNKSIARSLDLSVHTIKRHVANILDKLDARSRSEAAARWRGER